MRSSARLTSVEFTLLAWARSARGTSHPQAQFLKLFAIHVAIMRAEPARKLFNCDQQ